VPVAAVLGVLTIGHLLAVALLVGAFGTLGTVAELRPPRGWITARRSLRAGRRRLR
jgi:hypothetical protein